MLRVECAGNTPAHAESKYPLPNIIGRVGILRLQPSRAKRSTDFAQNDP